MDGDHGNHLRIVQICFVYFIYKFVSLVMLLLPYAVDFQRCSLWKHGSEHKRMDRRSLHSCAEEVSHPFVLSLSVDPDVYCNITLALQNKLPDETLNLIVFLFQDHRQCERRDWKEAVDYL